MAKRSKFFCIAVEGDTCDGRILSAQDLTEMAETYDRATYSARLNMEHIRGFSAEPPFNAYGDVNALKTGPKTIKLSGQDVEKLGLFAEVDALDGLIAVQGKGQKLFSSIEINPNFASTGKAYLQGLAVTDSPASLGTEIMEFAAGRVANGAPSPFADRKAEQGNFFSAARQIEGLEFVEPQSEQAGFFAELRDMIKGFSSATKEPDDASGATPPPPPPPPPAAPPVQQPANDNFAAHFAAGMEKLANGIEAQGKAVNDRMDAFETRFTELETSIDNTPDGTPRRPQGTGPTGNFAKTDC